MHRALLFGNRHTKTDMISAAQLHPLLAWQKDLARRGILEFDHVQGQTFGELAAAVDRDTSPIVIMRPDWREEPEVAVQTMEQLRARHPSRYFVFLDPYDQTSTRYFGVLPYVDRFLKYQRLKNVADYHRDLAGGTLVTDYVEKNRGFSLGDWSVSSELPEGQDHKVGTYWNFAFARDLQRQLQIARLRYRAGGIVSRLSSSRPVTVARDRLMPKKEIDVFCRLSFGRANPLEWYGQYRLQAVQALAPLKDRYRLAVDFGPEDAAKTSREQYRHEIKRSRIVFSPFGWGEVTWRDYEAAAHRCLLVKPSIDHIDVRPDIFVPNQTYVPVRWDFSDLAEKCEHYLEHPEEAERIMENAYRAYRSALHAAAFGAVLREEICDRFPAG